MAGRDETPEAGGTLGGRLRRSRARGFVGRAEEREWFAKLLDAPEPAIVWLHGPGGTGKSALVRCWAERADSAGLPTATIDLQVVEGTPARIRQALAEAFAAKDEEELAERFLDGRRYVLFFDTWEHGAACDGWVREAFLPALPESSIVVFSGRVPPTGAWRSDPGWRDLLRELALQNLPPQDGRALLAHCDVPDELHDDLIELTRGHPLALTLVAEVARKESAEPMRFEHSPNILGELMDRFVSRVPSLVHRRALRTAAHARFTTEAILREVVDADASRELFEWLRSLPFVSEARSGLFPHALAREVIDSDFRWRDPDGYRAQHAALMRLLYARLRALSGQARDDTYLEALYLSRINPFLHAYFDFDSLGSGWSDGPRADEEEALAAIVRAAEGEEESAMARFWLTRQPDAFVILRSSLGEPRSVTANLTLTAIDLAEARVDPIVAAVDDYVSQRGGLLPNERIVLTRFMSPRPRHGRFKLRHNRPQALWVTTPGIAYGVQLLPEADFWAPVMGYGNLQRVPEIEAQIGDRYGVWLHDFRTEPPDAWLELIIERNLTGYLQGAAELRAGGRVTLTRDELESATRTALRDYTRTDALAGNPLCAARCVAGGGVAMLRARLEEAVASLAEHPREEKYQRALQATFLRPAPTQEAAAERLGVPFSTYRRHLGKGIEHVVEWLWRRESGR